MGVPAFFRWLSKKYPAIVVHCVEEKPKKSSNGEKIPVDCSKPNPNDIEFDNLYLDMNGIIHPCCHPENKPAPKNEDEMMVAIFEYIDRLFAIIRPRRLLYMAIDGVAPRAKMNQQRSRRFRASKESYEKKEELARIRRELEERGIPLPPAKADGEHFDSNCITPGTPFMFRLAECLRFYIHDRLQNDPAWQKIKVILSDANVPGEGEHKIMDFIRKQRAQPDHDPNTKHCLCGADADLIMLGLATHELDFTIIREEFKPNQPRPCDICAQLGHEAKECTGAARQKRGEHDEFAASDGFSDVNFIFLRLCVLREYLERDLRLDGLPFKYDFERVLDDWVFMCFFVGNDFLPHLPSLEIREGAIDRLVRIYKETIYKMGGYLAEAGVVNMARVQTILSTLGFVEDEIFKNRRETELDFRRRDAAKKRHQQQFKKPAFMTQGQYAPQPISRSPAAVADPRRTAADGRMQGASASNQNSVNHDAAAALRSMLYRDEQPSSSSSSGGTKSSGSSSQTATSSSSSGSLGSSQTTTTTSSSGSSAAIKRSADAAELDEDAADGVRLWEDGWKDRYYQQKFGVDREDVEFRQRVAAAYARGLCWVLRYYYQGCASWDWYFPYHYAPFASDFHNLADLPNDFEKGTRPFQPLEQLMAVFPAASRQHVPPSWQGLMQDPESPIIDFYPTNFKIDLNGKKFAWMGVALLPFVDERRLLKAVKAFYPMLTIEEKHRNIRGEDRLFVGSRHPSYDFLMTIYEEPDGSGADAASKCVELATRLSDGMLGTVWACEFAVMRGSTLQSPLPSLEDLVNCRIASVSFKDPQYSPDFIYPAKVHPRAKPPTAALKPEGLIKDNQGNYRPQLGFQRGSGYRDNKNPAAAQRMVTNSLMGSYSEYGRVAPPQTSSAVSQNAYGGRGGQGSLLSTPPSSYSSNSGSSSGRYNALPEPSQARGVGGGAGAWQRNVQAGAMAYQAGRDHVSRPLGASGSGLPAGYHPYRPDDRYTGGHGWAAGGQARSGTLQQQQQNDYYGYGQAQRPAATQQHPSAYYSSATYQQSSVAAAPPSGRPSPQDAYYQRGQGGAFPPPAGYRRQ